MHIGSVFIGCILYADDLLLSGSCTGLQQMVDIGAKYDRTWDMCFNSSNFTALPLAAATLLQLQLV